MVITLQNITVYIAVIAFCGGIMRYMVISPLQGSIARLEAVIEKLSRQLDEQDVRIDDLKERLIAVEESTKQAHKRIDELKQ